MTIKYNKKDLTHLFNLGDSLCTPDNYFNISSDKSIQIIGGGVWDIQKYSNNQTVAWGIGISSKTYNKQNIDTNNLSFLEYGFRDLDLLQNKNKFVPCVSCFHEEIIQQPKQNGTLTFINANPDVSIQPNNSTVLTNSSNYETFITQWKTSDKLITNSYHGIYWGLLSGKEVIPYGYSSKFTSLMKCFDLEMPQSHLYRLNERNKLNDIMNKHEKTFRLSNPQIYVNRFRELNMIFIERLARRDISCQLKM